MGAKIFNMQSPEQIAKDYMGNKQKIVAAAQLGTVDPTAAVLAGMFIDRMRAAQVQEAAPSRTVAQDVLAPPQMGLGAAPAGMPPMGSPPPMGMPRNTPLPATAPPPAGPLNLGSPPPMGGMGPAGNMGPAAPAGAAAPAKFAGGGLADLPLSDDMFGYADGGMVAFAEGGEAELPQSFYGRSVDPMANMEQMRTLMGGQPTPRRQQLEDYYEQTVSPEAQERGRRGDMGSLMAQIGFGMAGTSSPSFLQALGQAGTAALPGAREAARARRAEVRQGMAALADIENMSAAERRAIVEASLRSSDTAVQGLSAKEGRDAELAARANEGALDRQAAMDRLRTEIGARGGGGGGGGGGGRRSSGEGAAPGFGTGDDDREAKTIYQRLRANPANARLPDSELASIARDSVRSATSTRAAMDENSGDAEAPAVRNAVAANQRLRTRYTNRAPAARAGAAPASAGRASDGWGTARVAGD